MSDAQIRNVPAPVNPEIMHIGVRLERAMPELEYYRRAKDVLQRHRATRFDNVPQQQQAATLVDLRLALALYLRDTFGPILPLQAELKEPWSAHAHHDASDDPKQIEQWVREKPNCNWGRPQSAIDVDTSEAHGKDGLGNWKALLAEFNGGKEPQTLRVKTPTGGLHYHVKTKLAKGDLRPGIEIPNYVVLPGSHVTANGDSVKVTGFYKPDNNLPIIDLPFLNKVTSAAPERGDNKPPMCDLDTDDAIARATELLQGYASSKVMRSAAGIQYNGPAIEGHHGDDWTVQVANNVGDLGVSSETCFELMRDHFNDACVPVWPLEGSKSLRQKVESAYRSRQQPLGVNTAQADFANDPVPSADEIANLSEWWKQFHARPSEIKKAQRRTRYAAARPHVFIPEADTTVQPLVIGRPGHER